MTEAAQSHAASVTSTLGSRPILKVPEVSPACVDYPAARPSDCSIDLTQPVDKLVRDRHRSDGRFLVLKQRERKDARRLQKYGRTRCFLRWQLA